VKGSFGLSGRTFRLFAAAILTCGIAAADTIIAGGVDATRGEYNLWIKQDGTNSNTYFANAIEIELSSSNGTMNRGALSVDLFTDISLNTANQTEVSVASQVSPASTATVLDRIASTLPLNVGVSTAAQGAEPQAAEPQVAGLAQHRNRRQRSRQSE
jgi:hypothetical protein